MTLLGRTVVEPDADALPVRIEVRGGRIAAVTPAPETAGQALPFVFPGFIDAHTHPVETGLQLLFVDLKAAVSVRDALDLLRERLETGRECGVMLGFNLEPERLAEQRFPTRNELDRLAGGLPTLVYRVDGHSAALNSAGLELLAHPWPGGVEMLADRTPSGTVRGPAYERLSQTFKRRLPPEGIRTALVLASDLGLRAGVTTMAAFVGGPELAAREWRELVDALAGLTIRAVPVLQTWDAAVAHGFGLPRVGGCLLLDGSFGSRTAALSRSYADAAGSGALYRTDAEVEGLVREASALGLQTAFHAIG
ncbi:amidohydrolase family protein, partial [candidate division WOR-3 bacterium]|nr:amidohydrolase family protein [candidate division WOR-3 bacterium]